MPEYEKERTQKVAQRTLLETVMENHVASLETLSNTEMIKAIEARYAEAQREHKRLTTEIAAMDENMHGLKAIHILTKSYADAVKNWDNMTRDEKRLIVQNLISRIEAIPVGITGIKLTIYWCDKTSNTVDIGRSAGNGRYWSDEETNLLNQLIDRQASQLEIAQAFPKRNWQAIKRKGYTLRGRGNLCFAEKPIADDENYEAYQARIGQEQAAGEYATFGEASRRSRRWTRQPAMTSQRMCR